MQKFICIHPLITYDTSFLDPFGTVYHEKLGIDQRYE